MAVGVFGLQVAYKLKRTELLSLDDTHGWFGGYGTITRMDFSNDSISGSTRGGLSVGASKMAATGNSNYGWFGGGYTGPSSFGGTPISIVNRIDFSNDSAAALSRGILSRARRNSAATGNSNYGWFGGGYTSETPNGPQSIVDRIDFSNDSTTASPRGALSLGRWSLAATGNSNYGWFGAGMVGGVTNVPTAGPAHSTVQRIDFSNDNTLTSVRGPLSIPLSASRYYQWAATGNSNYGWFGGGDTNSVGRIDFANDSEISLTRGPFTISRGFFAISATGNSSYGWFSNGASLVDRIDFSNDSSTASPRGSLASTNSATSGRATGASIKLQKAANFGWFGGGAFPFPSILSSVNRIDFANDSVAASPRGVLSSARYSLSATGNSNYGWFGGGNSSRVDRIEFSNDFATASPRGPLNFTISNWAAVSTSNYGWFGGDYMGRIDFANDSRTASPRTRLLLSRTYLAATGNSNYGWFGGGFYGGVSLVDRIDFSNDNARSLSRGPLAISRRSLAATGNSNYGWFAAGYRTTEEAAIDRIDFSNDTLNASLRVYATSRRGLTATGNSDYGWFGGGFPSVAASMVERLNFSNDLGSISLRGQLAAGRGYAAATSNTPIG